MFARYLPLAAGFTRVKLCAIPHHRTDFTVAFFRTIEAWTAYRYPHSLCADFKRKELFRHISVTHQAAELLQPNFLPHYPWIFRKELKLTQRDPWITSSSQMKVLRRNLDDSEGVRIRDTRVQMPVSNGTPYAVNIAVATRAHVT